MDQLIDYFLLLHNISFDKEELTFQVQSHPSYPSLHAITGVLDHFNIPNLALQIPKNEDTYAQLPPIFLAQINTQTGEDFVIVKKHNGQCVLFFSHTKKIKIKLDEFLKKFTGIILAIEKPEDAKQTNKAAKHKGSYSFFLIVSLLLIISIIVASGSNIVSACYFLMALTGIYISTAIFKQGQGEQSFLGDTFCAQTTKKNNCNSILTSKGAQLGFYTLSDYSIIYFVGIAIAALFLSLSQIDFNVLYTISLLALPVTIYSIYYQYAVAKTWCLLCLSIVAVLWIQALMIILTGSYNFGFNTITLLEILLVAASFFTAFAVWNILSPHLKQFKTLKESKIKYFRFKRDFSLFQTLLYKSKLVDTHIPNASEIVFGNKAASLVITLVTSPFCGHCKPVHLLIEQILKRYTEQVKLIIRFSVQEANTPLVEITTQLLNLYHTEGKDKCLEAMHDIYGAIDYEVWIKKWGVVADKSTYLETLRLERAWCQRQAVNFTPVILINGYHYPKEYERPDLIHFIEDLYEHMNTSTANVEMIQGTS